jgi:hypothetical protein
MLSPLERIRRSIRKSTAANQWMSAFLPAYKILAVTSRTEIVIEGYPRCANSFAVTAFLQSQAKPVNVAHHLHSIAQIRRGVQLSLPTLVLLREPRAAILSLAIRKEHASPKWAAEEYVDFHSGALKVSNHVVFADFEEVISDFGAVIRRLNDRFGCSFSEFVHTPENVAKCYEQIDSYEKRDAGGVRATHVARPSEDRRQHKDAMAALLDSSKLIPLVEESQRLYQALTNVRISQASTTRAERQP